MSVASDPLSSPELRTLVSYLVEPTKHQRWNATSFHKNGVKKELLTKGRPLKPIKGNLERIVRFKEDCLVMIKRSIAEELVDAHKKTDGGELSGTNLVTKNDHVSEILRQEGNKAYGRKQTQSALRCYTLACCYAHPASRNLALAYSNRSACFLESGNMAQCLTDIANFESIAKDWSDETDLKISGKVEERKRRCNDKLCQQLVKGKAEQVKAWANDNFRLYHPNAVVSAAESFVGIRDNDMRGRHVCNIGDKDIFPGTLVILEKPYAQVLLGHYKFELMHCTNCLKDLDGGGIPCPGCVFVLYCSEACFSASSHTRYECIASRYLYELNMNRTVQLCLAILLKLGPQGVVEHMTREMKMRQQAPEVPSNKIVGFSESGTYDSSSYEPIHKLIYHDEDESLLKQYAADAVILIEVLDAVTDFFSSHHPHEPLENAKSYASSLVLLHQMNLPCNAHSLYKLDLGSLDSPTEDEIRTSTVEEVGAGAFPLLSMVNHSCDPNVVRVTLPNGLTAVLAIKTIRPGGEVLDNYGSHFATEGCADRRNHLHSNYTFRCECVACEENWPTLPELHEKSEQPVYVCVSCNHNSKMLEQTRLQKSLYFCTLCKQEYEVQNLKRELDSHVNNHVAACKLLLENQPVLAFNNTIPCLLYFISNVQHPYYYINMTQEVVKQALFIIARHMFR